MPFFPPILKHRHKALVCAKLKAVQPSNFFLRTLSFGRQYLFILLSVTPKRKEQNMVTAKTHFKQSVKVGEGKKKKTNTQIKFVRCFTVSRAYTSKFLYMEMTKCCPKVEEGL